MADTRKTLVSCLVVNPPKKSFKTQPEKKPTPNLIQFCFIFYTNNEIFNYIFILLYFLKRANIQIFKYWYILAVRSKQKFIRINQLKTFTNAINPPFSAFLQKP